MKPKKPRILVERSNRLSQITVVANLKFSAFRNPFYKSFGDQTYHLIQHLKLQQIDVLFVLNRNLFWSGSKITLYIKFIKKKNKKAVGASDRVSNFVLMQFKADVDLQVLQIIFLDKIIFCKLRNYGLDLCNENLWAPHFTSPGIDSQRWFS